jgi:transposase
VKVIGVDEHVWRHTRRGDKYVTVIIDLTPIRGGTGASRLLDMVEGRSKQVFKTWLAARDKAWRDQLEVVAMDGFTGFKTATTEELPDAVAVMDPFHVVRLAGDALDQCRRRVQQDLRGRSGDPLFSSRRMLHTGTDLPTDKQHLAAAGPIRHRRARRGRSHLGHLCRQITPRDRRLQTPTTPSIVMSQ